ncbi:hypothetical protein HLH33_17215 [Gluconacetobacter diazotrophicus]|uniref:Uncharacterized protein n=1 Tax=Gluconacetobacter diazotrophicus TaxID=33996 RepID=A0A7W4I826_GLUDI|nr:hypothetical protein [Gluconacetobacter diazotrophicus]MBB2158013.1 hypothetical protein [Gluconacetobacter diazotrophicus]
MRTGVSGLPVEKQESALKNAGFSGEIYRDDISPADLKARNVAALVGRADLLRPIKRKVPEIIAVASLRCIALTPVDLTGVLVAAAKRNATICAVDTEERYPPDAGVEGVQAAMLAWDKGQRVGQTAAAREAGKAARGAYSALLADRREKALAIARPLWPVPSDELTSQEIADKAGLTVASLIRYLGPRREAQRIQERKRK